MDYNNYNNSNGNDQEPKREDIFSNEEQFRAYAPRQEQEARKEENMYYGSQQGNDPYGNGYYNGSYNGNVNFVLGGEPVQKPKKKKGRVLKWIAATMAGVLVIGGAAAGGVYVGSQLVTWQQAGNEDVPVVEENTQVQLQTNIGSNNTNGQVEYVVSSSDVSAVVENAMPSIVAINYSSEYDVSSFWGQQYTQQAQGSGSGIIIGQNKEEVLIVTNNHVVKANQNAKNEQIEVVFGDESSAPATIKGTEEGSDLAVVAVKLQDLTDETMSYIKIATLGDSDSLKVGEMAIAIGNALGYGQSTTVGWISALEREVATEDYTMSLIQTDAAINPGNSGGALLNIRGEVVGINSAKYSDESVEGMGFAIPITDAIPIINDLMNREIIPEEEQSYLGIVGQDVTEAYHERYGMPIGVYVYQVSKGSPAEAAGLQMGDIITAFNSRKITCMADLQSILATYRAGEEVTLTIQIYENGTYTEQTIHATLGYKNR